MTFEVGGGCTSTTPGREFPSRDSSRMIEAFDEGHLRVGVKNGSHPAPCRFVGRGWLKRQWSLRSGEGLATDGECMSFDRMRSPATCSLSVLSVLMLPSQGVIGQGKRAGRAHLCFRRESR